MNSSSARDPFKKTKEAGRRSTGPWLGRSLVQPAVVGLFHRYGILNGARLAEILGVGRSSAHLILERLHRESCLVVEPRKTGEPMLPGRPTTDYRLNASKGLFVGISLSPAQSDWCAMSYDGALADSGRLNFSAKYDSGKVLARHIIDHVKGLSRKLGDAPILHLSIAIDGHLSAESSLTISDSPLLVEREVAIGKMLEAELQNTSFALLTQASAGAISESLKEYSTPAPTLFISAQNSFACSAGYAISGRMISGKSRRGGALVGVAKRHAAWLANSKSSALAHLDWAGLVRAANDGDSQAKELASALLAEFASEISHISNFLDVARIVLESPDDFLAAHLVSSMPSSVRVERGFVHWGSVARGAAILPIASAVTRAIDFEHGAHQPDTTGHIPPVLLDFKSA